MAKQFYKWSTYNLQETVSSQNQEPIKRYWYKDVSLCFLLVGSPNRLPIIEAILLSLFSYQLLTRESVEFNPFLGSQHVWKYLFLFITYCLLWWCNLHSDSLYALTDSTFSITLHSKKRGTSVTTKFQTPSHFTTREYISLSMTMKEWFKYFIEILLFPFLFCTIWHPKLSTVAYRLKSENKN